MQTSGNTRNILLLGLPAVPSHLSLLLLTSYNMKHRYLC